MGTVKIGNFCHIHWQPKKTQMSALPHSHASHRDFAQMLYPIVLTHFCDVKHLSSVSDRCTLFYTHSHFCYSIQAGSFNVLVNFVQTKHYILGSVDKSLALDMLIIYIS